jgi:phenylacetate-CoA ligase
MLVVRGVNVFPSEIEDVVLEHPALGGQYAIVLDRRGPLAELEVRAELAEPGEAGPLEPALADRLAERLRVRTRVRVGPPGSLPRQEVGKARRVFEQLDDRDPLVGG